MIIPAKLQGLFPEEVFISDKDHERLKPLLRNWNLALQPVIMNTCDSDLKRMILIELMDKKRWYILDRILARLNESQAAGLKDKVRKLL